MSKFQIINEEMTASQYRVRRATYLDKTAIPTGTRRILATAAAVKVFGDGGSRLAKTVLEINDAEATNGVAITTAKEIAALNRPSQHTYCKAEYEEIRALSLQRMANTEHAQRDTELVFGAAAYSVSTNAALRAIRVLRGELAAGISPLLPLPSTGNTETMDAFFGVREDLLPLSALDELLLTNKQRGEVLATSLNPSTPFSSPDQKVPMISPISLPTKPRFRPADVSAEANVAQSPLDRAPSFPPLSPSPLPRSKSAVLELKSPEAATMSSSTLVTEPRSNKRKASVLPSDHGIARKKPRVTKQSSDRNDDDSDGEKEEKQPVVTRKIRAVIIGVAIPANENEAREAATHRRANLLRKRLEQGSQRITVRSGANMAFFPEFAATNRKASDIACVCGNDSEDVDSKWVACDKCGVWQHVECMGEAVPEDLELDDYSCQQCDPFAHRKLIAELRRMEPVPDDVLPPLSG